MIALITILGWVTCLAVAVGIASQELEIKITLWRFQWRYRRNKGRDLEGMK